MQSGSSQWYPVKWQEATGMKHKNFHLNVIKKIIYHESDQTAVQVSHRGCGVPIPKDIQCMTGHNLLQPAQAEPAWEGN